MKYLLFLPILLLTFCKTDSSSSTDIASADTTEKIVRKDLSVMEANKWLQSDNPPVLLDVRTSEEYSEGHIEGSTLIDYNSSSFDSKLSELDKDESYLLYCRSGNRSGKAVHKMIGLGFTDVTNMVGGYNAWSSKY